MELRSAVAGDSGYFPRNIVSGRRACHAENTGMTILFFLWGLLRCRGGSNPLRGADHGSGHSVPCRLKERRHEELFFEGGGAVTVYSECGCVSRRWTRRACETIAPKPKTCVSPVDRRNTSGVPIFLVWGHSCLTCSPVVNISLLQPPSEQTATTPQTIVIPESPPQGGLAFPSKSRFAVAGVADDD